jgi:hypothetical protein
MDGNLEMTRDIASPLVVAGNAVRISGFDTAQEIDAERIAAVIAFAEAPQFAVREAHRLNLGEQCRARLHRPGRCGAAPLVAPDTSHDDDDGGCDTQQRDCPQQPYDSESAHLASSLDQGVDLRMRRAVPLFVLCLILHAATAEAHHSFAAEYDGKKPASLPGP